MNYQMELANIISEFIKEENNNIKIDWKSIFRFIKESNKKIDSDWSINCFSLKSILQKDGKDIAIQLKSKFTSTFLKKFKFIEEIQISGPYLNFKINKAIMAEEIFTQVMKNTDLYAKDSFKEFKSPKRIVIEFPAPNTNKPLHLGHIRNMLLGQTLSVINKHVGNKVFQVNLLNDRGVHICKSMWAYDKWGNNKTPESEGIKSDHFVGNYYVLYSKEEMKLRKLVKNLLEKLEKERLKPKNVQDANEIKNLEEKIGSSKYGKLQSEIKQMLLDWEEKNPRVRKLWSKMNDWAEKGFEETYKIFNIIHEKTYRESEIYDKGKEIVLKGLKKNIFEKLDDGAVVVRFKKKNLPKMKVLIRKEGTTLYITQDIHLAYKKMEDFNYDLSIYVVGNEQDMQFRTVFEILKILGMKGENLHYSYGMINLTSGKMKSREGNTVDADNIVQKINNLAKVEVKKRYTNLDGKEIDYRSQIISMAALRFFILKYDYSKDFIFDPKVSLSFEGETGPYLMYVYARVCSIFKKGMELGILVPFDPIQNSSQNEFYKQQMDYKQYQTEDEIILIKLIYKYPEIIKETVTDLKPHILARYLLTLSQEFNQFYHSCQILKEQKNLRHMRLFLSEIVRRILKNGLKLLSIDVLNEM